MGEPDRKPDHDKLAAEARAWDTQAKSPTGWQDAPDAVPKGAGSQLVSIRLPHPLLAIIKEFAAREGLGYQVLLKRWLDERVRLERRKLEHTIALPAPHVFRMAACFDADGLDHVSSELE